MEVIHGPVIPSLGGVIYQITLASGMIVTSPAGFADPSSASSATRRIIVTEDGRVLVPAVAMEAPAPLAPAA